MNTVQPTKKEILFIDANVADKQTLIAGVAPNIKVVELNDKSNVLDQMVSALKGQKNLDAIHIISHGSEGELDFSSGSINNSNLSTYSKQLKKIGQSLSKDGDILLYGCDVAKGADGNAFINSLAKFTKADIAASTDATGTAILGGDWNLESHTGKIETQIFSSISYANILVTPSNQNFDSALTINNTTNSLTLNGITYTTNGIGKPDVYGYTAFTNETITGFSGNALFSDLGGSADSSITFAEFKTADGSDFKLNGLSASALDTAGSFPKIYTITGYAGGSGGTQVISVSNFDFGTTGSYGSGTAAISYTRTSTTYNAGTFVFGSGWDHIDTVRFTSTGGVEIVLDNLNFSDPTVIDITPPTISSVAITSATGAQNSTLNAGDVVTATVTMSEATNVTGTPQLALNIGGTTVQANYAGGTGTAVLTFTYTIQASDTDTNGISIDANSLSLNSGTLQDAAGNNATLTHSAVTDNSSYMVDTTAPSFDVSPTAGTVTSSGFTPSASLDESGTIYYVVVPNNAPAPSVANVKAGVASGGGAALTSGNSSANTGSFDSSFSAITSLSASTAYDAYFVATDAVGNDQTSVTKVTQTTASIPPTITSATYDSSTNVLTVTGANMTTGDTIDATKLTFTGEGNGTYTLAGSYIVSASSATTFSITLTDTDAMNVEGLLNNMGTSSLTGTPSTTYNLAGATNWDVTKSAAADLTGNGITVNSTSSPTITSATYDAGTGTLTVTGTNMVATPGGTNDITVSRLKLTGEGGSGSAYFLTSSNVELTSSTEFSITLNTNDKTAVDAILNKNGTSSTGGTTYNLSATGTLTGVTWDTFVGDNPHNDTTNAVTVSGLNAAPTFVQFTAADSSNFVLGTPQYLDIDNGSNNLAAQVYDTDSINFNTGNLTVVYNSGTTASLKNGSFLLDTVYGSILSGNDGIIVAGEDITDGTNIFGTVGDATHDGQNGNPLVITFNANAVQGSGSNVSYLLQFLQYTAPSLEGGRIFDVTVNDGAGGTSAVSTVTLTGVDQTAPTLDGVNSTPVAGATGVAPSANLVIDFSENVAFGTSGTIVLHNVTTNTDVETFTISSGSSTGTASITNDKLTLNPAANLSASTDYSVRFFSRFDC